jgi:probable HAF family extracellular repeat protein
MLTTRMKRRNILRRIKDLMLGGDLRRVSEGSIGVSVSRVLAGVAVGVWIVGLATPAHAQDLAGKLVSAPPGEHGAFGRAVAYVSGDFILVGAPFATLGPGAEQQGAGSVTMYDLFNCQWVPGQVLQATEPQNSGRFGHSVAADGDYAVIGSLTLSMEDLGDLGETGFHSATAVSEDGTVVVGELQPFSGGRLGFRWVEGIGMIDLIGFGGSTTATGVSDDGTIVVGWSQTENGTFAFRWTEADGVENIGNLGGNYTLALAISGDGTTIVGESRTVKGLIHAFRWTAGGGMQDLGTIDGGSWAGFGSRATAVSSDGSVVVGDSHNPDNNFDHAFRWVSTDGIMQDLGTLGGRSSHAWAVSGAGGAVIGSADIGLLEQAPFRWTPSGGMQVLDVSGDNDTFWATDISANGTTYVGWHSPDLVSLYAARWSEQEGLVDLGTLSGSESSARAVSSDGQVIVGTASLQDGSWRAFRSFGGRGGSVAFYHRPNLTFLEVGVFTTPNDLDNAYFGWSVDIFYDRENDAVTAVVGAPEAKVNDLASVGEAFVYERVNDVWTQVARLTPPNPTSPMFFGESVAIDGDRILVGAPQANGSAPRTGVVYEYTRQNGTWSTTPATIADPSGLEGDWFGTAVALDGKRMLTSAVGRSDWTGVVYPWTLDEQSQWQMGSLFTGSDVDLYHLFGEMIAIDGNSAVIGTRYDYAVGEESGAAYIFAETDNGWEQLAYITSPDPQAGANFGLGVAIERNTVVIGAPHEDAGDDRHGVVYVVSSPLDSDEDGLTDDWELNGIPYVKVDGTYCRYKLDFDTSPDPFVKDLFVEVDKMSGMSGSFETVLLLETAFADAPMTNPDNPDGTPNSDGVNLHILIDDSDLPHVAIWDTDGCWPLDFDNWRLNNYGTTDERADPDSVPLLAAKAKAVRYCIIADSSDNPTTPNEIESVGGCGQTPGDNFVMFIGGPNYDNMDVASVFMHELGHNLGLKHGGGDDINGKPNYPSIMNYVFGYRYNWNADFWTLDFSREGPETFATLNESTLIEALGIGSPGGYYSCYKMPFGINDENNVRTFCFVTLDGSPTDFGDTAGTMFQDGSLLDIVSQDINYAADGPDVPDGIPSSPSFPELLVPFNDWENVDLELAAAKGAGAPAPVFPTDELTTDAIDWINENIPPPPGSCAADLTGDGILDFFDVAAFLAAFSAQDPIADLTGDGIFDFFDVAAYLADFSAGCP